jgi:hypothetical protein
VNPPSLKFFKIQPKNVFIKMQQKNISDHLGNNSADVPEPITNNLEKNDPTGHIKT